MPYSIIFDDIETCETDALINNIGVKAKEYEQLYNNIIEKIDSLIIKEQIEATIKENKEEIFITDGGKLKAKQIVHAIYPTKKVDSKNNDNLVYFYQKIFDRAIKEKYKSIVVPFIATNANEFLDNEVYEAINKAAANIVEQEDKLNKEILDIRVAILNKTKDKYKNKLSSFKKKEREAHVEINGIPPFTNIESIIQDNELYPENNFSKRIREISYLMGILNDNLMMFIPSTRRYKFPFDFVIDWLCRRDKKESVLVGKTLLSKDTKKHIKNKKKMEKYEIYAIANELGMSIEDIVELMIINGTSFDPQDKIDCFEIDYLLGKYGQLSKYEYSQASYEILGIWISLNNAEYYKQLQEFKKKNRR